MPRAPDWTVDEFDVLLGSHGWREQQLASRLPRRTPGAIDAVGGAVHSFHTAGDSVLLSEIMRKELQGRPG